MINRLQGKKENYSWEKRGKEAPGNYDELFEEVESRTLKEEDVEKVVERRLKREEEQRAKQLEEERVNKTKELEEKQKTFDAEWYDLVNKGHMPKVDDKLQERINKGESISREEAEADEGLRARMELATIVQSTNKHPKVAYYEDLNKEPAGARAPVIGTRPRSPLRS